MNLKILEESSKRSKSLKRYSLNRKTKEKERKERMTKSVEDGTQSLPCSPACGADANATCEDAEKDILCLNARKEDSTGKLEKVISAATVVVSQELPIGTIKKTHQPAYGVNTHVMSQRLAPTSVRPDTKNPPMAPCGPAELRSVCIASQLKNHPSKQTESLFPAQLQCTGRAPNYVPHHENFRAAPRYFLAPNLPYNGNTIMHSAAFMNIPQNNPVMYTHAYMTPFQSPGFHASQIAHTQIRMQQNREAYNAFTAYGHPFGVFWSRQN